MSDALTVIPGRIEDANPESMAPLECWEKWIPGLRLTAYPGMTGLSPPE